MVKECKVPTGCDKELFLIKYEWKAPRFIQVQILLVGKVPAVDKFIKEFQNKKFPKKRIEPSKDPRSVHVLPIYPVHYMRMEQIKNLARYMYMLQSVADMIMLQRICLTSKVLEFISVN